MNNDKIGNLVKRKSIKQKQYNNEKDINRKKRLYLEIQILDLREKIERLK